MKPRFILHAGAAFILLYATPGFAEDGAFAERGTLSLIYENDTFAATDRNYTNGIDLSYLSAPNAVPALSRWLAEALFQADGNDTVYAGIGLGQSIFTPEDTRATLAPPNQHPYAGWLHLALSTVVDSGTTLDTLAFDAGVVGPGSGGEWVQNNVHDLLGADEANGWSHQIQNEFGFMLTYERKWRAIAEWRAAGGLGVDIVPDVELSFGNVLTQGAAGLTLRFGQDLANDYGPPRIRPALAGAGFFTPRDRFSWYVFAGASGRAVAYNIVLDGNYFTDGGPSVHSNTLVAEGQAGVAIQFGRVQTSFTVITRTEEFKDQGKQELFGAVSISVKL